MFITDSTSHLVPEPVKTIGKATRWKKLNFTTMLRDLIWTLIVIWLVYKITGWFRASSAKKQTNSGPQMHSQNTAPPNKNRFDQEGEYVDFEEMK